MAQIPRLLQPPDITRQIGPFFADAAQAEENKHMMAMRRMGFKWFRITREGRMSMIEGWKGASPPDNPTDVPELRGKLPYGWQAGAKTVFRGAR